MDYKIVRSGNPDPQTDATFHIVDSLGQVATITVATGSYNNVSELITRMHNAYQGTGKLLLAEKELVFVTTAEHANDYTVLVDSTPPTSASTQVGKYSVDNRIAFGALGFVLGKII